MPSDTMYLYQIREAVLEMVGGSLFSPVKATLVALAVDEAVANVMEHSYGQPTRTGGTASGDQEIEIVLDATAARFEVRIRDHGTGFNPAEVPEVDPPALARHGHRGGLGLFLMRRIMDEIHYSFGTQNELQMVKYTSSARSSTRCKLAVH